MFDHDLLQKRLDELRNQKRKRKQQDVEAEYISAFDYLKQQGYTTFTFTGFDGFNKHWQKVEFEPQWERTKPERESLGDPWLDDIAKHWPLLRRRSVATRHPGDNQYANYLFEKQLQMAEVLSHVMFVGGRGGVKMARRRFLEKIKAQEYIEFEEIKP